MTRISGAKKKLGKLKPTDFLVKTIVTTEVIAEIAKKNNVELRDCYTGFKWIAREIAISEGKQQYIGGGEESFGFLPYDKVRDKDAPASICLICEIARAFTAAGSTIGHDVPDGALGIERAKQAEVAAWGAKKLEKYVAKKQKLEAEKKND